MMKGERGLDHFVMRDPDRPARQRTIEATIDWSHELLGPREQRVLRRLAVFRGTFGLAEAQRLLATDGHGTRRGVAGRSAASSSARWSRRRRRCRTRRVCGSSSRSGRSRCGSSSSPASSSRRARSTRRVFVRAGDATSRRGCSAPTSRSAWSASRPTTTTSVPRSAGSSTAATATEALQRSSGRCGGCGSRTGTSRRAARGCGAHSASTANRRASACARCAPARTWRGGRATTRDRTSTTSSSRQCATEIGDAWGLAWAPMGHGAVRAVPRSPPVAADCSRTAAAASRSSAATGRPATRCRSSAARCWFAGEEQAALQAFQEAVEIFERLEHRSVLASVQRSAGLMAARCGDLERGGLLCRAALRRATRSTTVPAARRR